MGAIAWNWIGRDKKTPRGERIRKALEDLGPIFVKFGQIASTRRDLLPDDIAEELTQLQDRVPAFPTEQARRIIEQAYKQPINHIFASFDSEPLASASVAQVYAAKLKDGRDVVGADLESSPRRLLLLWFVELLDCF